MPKALRVTLDDDAYREIDCLARSRHLSVAEWVRQAVYMARREEGSGDVARKLAAIRAAAKYESPTGNIDTMLAEIERGIWNGL